MRKKLGLLVLGLFLCTATSEGSVSAAPSSLLPPVSSNDALGFDFVSGAGYNISEQRYQQAIDAGASWTRWPIYWQDIETSPGRLDDAAYAAQDAVVSRDRAHGLQINGILLGTPSWVGTSGSALVAFPRVERKRVALGYGITASVTSAASSVPQNLYQPVFNSDGSINQNNYWARFVYTTVQRYKDSIKVWEMWNEPDLKTAFGTGVFWNGSREDYYQLLKVGYQAAKAADPSATVLFAGLAYWSDPDFFPHVIDLMANDPTATANGYYFDAIPWHLYVSPYHLYNFAVWSRGVMEAKGLSKAIWANETNIPVCDDKAVDPDLSCPTQWRGTMEEQASFIIQAVALGKAGGMQRIFGFQLYDDSVGPHEWYGFIRNDASPRPAYTSYQVAAKYLVDPISVVRTTEGDIDKVVFEGTPNGRVTVVWNRGPTPITGSVTARSSQAMLVDKYGNTQTISPSDGQYRISLPGATYRDAVSGVYDIGGNPYLLVEESSPRVSSEVVGLPSFVTATSFQVSWRRTDGTGESATFDIQYKLDNGAWTNWLVGTSATSATFGPSSPVAVSQGHTYYFRSRARDSRGYAEPYPNNACSCDASTSVAHLVTGQVTNNRGSPIFAATVQAANVSSVYSGGTGNYRLPVFPSGTHTISASKAGYGQVPGRTLSVSQSFSYRFYLPPVVNPVQNWGFEGNGGVSEWWTPSGQTTTSTTYMHGGSKAAKLGEVGSIGDSSLAQTGINVSQNSTNTLAFMYSVLGTPAAGDSFTVTVAQGTKTQTTTISLGVSGWTLKWIDVSTFGGATDVTFTFHQNSGSTARVFIDEVSIGTSAPETIYSNYFPLVLKSYNGGW